MGDNIVVLMIAGVVGIIMLFAQVQLFSIASSLKDILKELRKLNSNPPAAVPKINVT